MGPCSSDKEENSGVMQNKLFALVRCDCEQQNMNNNYAKIIVHILTFRGVVPKNEPKQNKKLNLRILSCFKMCVLLQN